ncbi:MAG: Polyphosphate kinase [Herbinix sp.]|jgi:polyphosphate kinase|nr:Polyphosphate kinase [Herbinix sp.]
MHSHDEIENNYMQNRELSWLTFNERILEETQDQQVPFYEQLKFVSIFTSNLDEFYMIRVGSLTDLSLMESSNIDKKSGMTPKQQLDKIYKRSAQLYKKRDEIYEAVESNLRSSQISNLNMSELSKQEKKYIERYYHEYMLPLLSPQVINARHPFPHLVNKELYIICVFSGAEARFGLIPVSKSLPKYVLLPGDALRYVMTEKILRYYLKDIFSMYKIENSSIISVTRNADISIDDEAFEVDDNFRERMKKVLKKRNRLSPVRLEIQGHMNRTLLLFLLDKLNLEKHQVFTCKAPLVLSYVFQLRSQFTQLQKKQLCYSGFDPAYPEGLRKTENITEQCKVRDVLLFYPYHQMEPFLNLLKESAADPNVLSIKITIYRVSDNSRLIEYLCIAAENNKEVTVLMELKARFDEQNNIEWAERLEEAGCNIIYGFEGFKVHSKICLITRRDNGVINYITQIGTGNYNEKTAKLYTDLSLITADRNIGQDAMLFFKNMSLSNLNGEYNHLLVAPNSLKNNLLKMMDDEIEKAKRGEECGIIIKTNSMTDKDIIQKLSEASIAGVEIKMIIRGICCLLPNIPGKTENISVISIVGRFLEHSRIYLFGRNNDRKMYISSADIMTRNTSRRVEIACPIYNPDIQEQILQHLHTMLEDNVKGRNLNRDGSYSRRDGADVAPIDSQLTFIQQITVNKYNLIPAENF